MKRTKAFGFFALVLLSVISSAHCKKDHSCADCSPAADTLQAPIPVIDTSYAPAYKWQEHWFEHNQNLTRMFYDSNLVVYYDGNMSSAITWPNTYLARVWDYTKKTYGAFGKETRLYAVFHRGRYSGGHPSTYFDASHDFHNTIDCGADDMNAWTTGQGNDLDLSTHEVGHIVEGASKGFHNSPAFGLWGDSKWMEIFIYDVYKGLNMQSDADRWYAMQVVNHDDFPAKNSFWFRDWFYPIYSTYGGTAVLNKYFTLLAQYYPKDGKNYNGDMNWGQFIHFWSGAAGTNLKPLATKAFGWPAEWQTQFEQAQKDFPLIKY